MLLSIAPDFPALFADKSFVVYDDRLYLIGGSPLEGYPMIRRGRRFSRLNESMDLPSLEQRFFESLKNEIKDYVGWEIDKKLAEPLRWRNETIRNPIDLFSTNFDERVTDFLLHQVVNTYNGWGVPDGVDTIPVQDAQLSLDELVSTPSYFTKEFGDGLYYADGQFKRLSQTSPNGTEIWFQKRGLSVEGWKSVHDVVSRYHTVLLTAIEHMAIEKGRISLRASQDKILEDEKRAMRTSRLDAQDPRSEIHVDRLNPGYFRIYLQLPSAILKIRQRYYFFNSVQTGINLECDRDLVRLSAPKVFQPIPYNHPFVWSTNDICCAGEYGDYAKRGLILPNVEYPLDNPHLAKGIVSLLVRTKRVLHEGYLPGMGEGFGTPVLNISNFTPLNLRGIEDVKSYMRSRGMNFLRQFKDNDGGDYGRR